MSSHSAGLFPNPLRVLVTLAASLTLTVAAGVPQEAKADVTSTFDTGVEGWSVITIGSVDWIPYLQYPAEYGLVGNPGGYISMQDPDNRSFFFDAPSGFKGDLAWAYRGTLSFDRYVIDDPGAISTDYADVLLYGSGLTIGYDVAIPGPNWVSDTVPLHEGAWTYLDGTAVTPSDFLTVLASVDRLAVRGEHYDGEDSGGLDNVRISSPSTSADLVHIVPVGAFATSASPNPFHPRTTISFELPGPSAVNVSVFDIGGRHVATLADGWRSSGRHEVQWSGLDPGGHAVVAGQYFAHVRTEAASETLKILLLR